MINPWTWTPYGWPDLSMVVVDDVNALKRRWLGSPKCLAMQTYPETMIAQVVGTELDEYEIDGGGIAPGTGWDGTICSVDAGDLTTGLDGGNLDGTVSNGPIVPMFALGVFKVVTPVRAGNIDIMMMITNAGATGQPRHEDVSYPAGATPEVGDPGTAWRLPDYNIAFFPFEESGSLLDGKVKISSDDTTENYLNNKVLAGHHLTKTVNDGGANETLTIDESGTRRDHTQPLALERRTSDASIFGCIWIRMDL